ncbi:MAG: transaldolase [Verrucomicrobiaceae bacterium]|nr:MAG: transaldolase [Verrucomicrobiaceae bacterium]
MLNPLQLLDIDIYADGADKASLLEIYRDPLVKGLTTNPTLMKAAGITNYESFAREVLEEVKDKPISFEVFSDDFPEMRRQALKIKGWQDNVFVKIPITNSMGESSIPLIQELSAKGVQLNVTALLTLAQVEAVAAALDPSTAAVVSVFAGRVADTGVDPVPLMKTSREILSERPYAQLLWASVREIINIRQAAESGAHIVTVPHPILRKALKMWGQDLTDLSLDTVKMFANDAAAAGYSL